MTDRYEIDIINLHNSKTASTVTVIRDEDFTEFCEKIREIVEDHRGDENYMPSGRLKEIGWAAD